LHSIYDQPAENAQYDRVLETLAHKLSNVAAHLEKGRPDRVRESVCW